MNNINQAVQIYYSMLDAYRDMKKYINNGWKVHTCTMGCYMAGYSPEEKVLVVYEKELDSWN